MPPFRAHQEEVRDVSAGNEQDDADGREQNPENCPTLRITSVASGRTFGRSSSRANAGGRSEMTRAASALAWASVMPGFIRASA